MKQYLSSVFFDTGNSFSVTKETLHEDAHCGVQGRCRKQSTFHSGRC